jgi:RNA polymerase primary sigma factor
MDSDDLHELTADEEHGPTEVFAEGIPDAPDSIEEAADEEIRLPDIEHFDDAIKMYLREVQKTKLLSADEERELAERIANGDKSARDRMIESNLRLVVKIAKRYMKSGLPFLDLIEEGNLGLIKAVSRFKISKECRFSTYGTWWIRQSIERAIVNQSRTVRLPVHVSEDINKMLKANRGLVRKMNREPSIKEVSAEMEVNIPYVRRLMVLLKKTYSLDLQMGENSDYSLSDIIEDTSTVSAAEHAENLNRYELIAASIDTLSASERKILTLRFGLDDNEPQTLETIGLSFGVTRERIRQIEAKSLLKLRNMVGMAPSGPNKTETC